MVTTTMKFSDTRMRLGHIFNEVEYGHRRVVVARRGRESVAIVSVTDLRALEACEQQVGHQGGDTELEAQKA
jgi:prevent-host-death family protein